MKVYCCRVKDNPSVYLKRIRLVGDSYIPVTDSKDITFSGDREEMEKVARMCPEFEVCCLEADPVPVSSSIQPMQLQ